MLSSIDSAEDSRNWRKTCSLTSSGTDGEPVDVASALGYGISANSGISQDEVDHVQSKYGEENQLNVLQSNSVTTNKY
jgi:hypothetical protein